MKQRGNKLFAGSRMILPEHREQMLKQDEENEKVAKPLPDEQQQERMNHMITGAETGGDEVRVTYYHNGQIYAVVCRVHGWDVHAQTLRIEDEAGKMLHVPFSDVLNVE